MIRVLHDDGAAATPAGYASATALRCAVPGMRRHIGQPRCLAERRTAALSDSSRREAIARFGAGCLYRQLRGGCASIAARIGVSLASCRCTTTHAAEVIGA